MLLSTVYYFSTPHTHKMKTVQKGIVSGTGVNKIQLWRLILSPLFTLRAVIEHDCRTEIPNRFIQPQ